MQVGGRHKARRALGTCNRFYKIQCAPASRNGINVAQLRSWNSEINTACSNLWLD